MSIRGRSPGDHGGGGPRHLYRYGVAIALATILFAPAHAALAAPDEKIERDLIALTNVDRTSNGLGSLLPEPRLTDIARERSDDMLVRNYFSHGIPPTGERVFVEMDRRGLVYEAAGENIGWNTAARDATVQFVQRDFMNSPLHRENVLRGVFTRIGVGSVPITGKIMHTVLFLKPNEAPAPSAAPAPTPAPPSETPEEAAE